jgi:hypothetical protein
MQKIIWSQARINGRTIFKCFKFLLWNHWRLSPFYTFQIFFSYYPYFTVFFLFLICRFIGCCDITFFFLFTKFKRVVLLVFILANHNLWFSCHQSQYILSYLNHLLLLFHLQNNLNCLYFLIFSFTS